MMGLGQRPLPLLPLSSSPPKFHHEDHNRKEENVDDIHPHLHRMSFRRISSSSSSGPHASSVCKSVYCTSSHHNHRKLTLSKDVVKVKLCRSVSEGETKSFVGVPSVWQSALNSEKLEERNQLVLEERKSAAVSVTEGSLSPAAQAHKDFLKSMKQLKECGWYWGPLSYEEAEAKLMDKCDGSFLVRDSSNENYILSLSFKSLGQVHHTRIEHHKGLFSFWSQPDSHGKAHICQFIEQTVRNSRNGRFLYFLRPSGPGLPPLPIQLLYPVSRFCRVPSLQHMCRFLVLRCVRRDHIDHLPIPEKVKNYLLEKQYYVETLDED